MDFEFFNLRSVNLHCFYWFVSVYFKFENVVETLSWADILIVVQEGFNGFFLASDYCKLSKSDGVELSTPTQFALSDQIDYLVLITT